MTANIPTYIHRDVGDDKKYLRAFNHSGRSHQAWLVLYTIGVKLRFSPADAVLLNTYLLPYYIEVGEIDGDQKVAEYYSTSFFNREDIFDWVMEQHEKETNREDNVV